MTPLRDALWQLDPQQWGSTEWTLAALLAFAWGGALVLKYLAIRVVSDDRTRTQQLRPMVVCCVLCKAKPVWGDGPYCQQCEGWEVMES